MQTEVSTEPFLVPLVWLESEVGLPRLSGFDTRIMIRITAYSNKVFREFSYIENFDQKLIEPPNG